MTESTPVAFGVVRPGESLLASLLALLAIAAGLGMVFYEGLAF